MKTFDFSKTGGFPLTQGVTDKMQDSYNEILQGFLGFLQLDNPGKYIIGGMAATGGNIADGWLVVDGELYKFTGGAGSYVELKEDTESVTFEDTASKQVWSFKYASVATTAGANKYLISEFTRINNNITVVRGDCTHLADRSYSFDLPKHTRFIHLDNESDFSTTSGFILNKITPFDSIPEGYTIVVRCGIGTGLTYLTKNTVASNLLFNQANAVATDLINRPFFGAGNFIGSRSGGAFNDGMGYDENLHFKFRWSNQYSKWIEIARFSLKTGSI